MATLTESDREAAFARGTEALMRIVGRLEPGQHLLGCKVDLRGGASMPARVLIDVTGPELDDMIGMEPSQMTAFAMVLGSGLLNTGTAHCEVMMHSKTAPDAVPVEQAWEMVPAATPDAQWLRPLSAFEARNRYTPEPADSAALTFRSAFDLDTEDEAAALAAYTQQFAEDAQRRTA